MENNVLNENDLSIVKEYLNWLKYEPKHWNIGELLLKSNNELTSKEKAILKLKKKDLELIPIFESYIINNDENSSKVVNTIINNMSIFDFANMKLSKEEVEQYNDKLYNLIYLNNDLDITPKEKLLSIIDNLNPEESITDSYINHMINIRLKNLEKSSQNISYKTLNIKKIIKKSNKIIKFK